MHPTYTPPATPNEAPPPAAPAQQHPSAGHAADRAYARYREALAGRPLPLAFVDLDRFDENAAALARLAAGTPVRLATKSVRCVALIQRALQRHPAFRGLMSYSIPEAAFLAQAGFDDILVAYPSAQTAELRVAAAMAGTGKRICVMVDCQTHVDLAAGAAEAVGAVLPVCIDLDLSTDYRLLRFGARRSPLRTVEQVTALARAIRARPSLRLDGIMGYEAQLAGVPDSDPDQRARSAVVRLLKRDSSRRLFRFRQQAVSAVRALQPDLRFVNGGGTGSLGATRGDGSVTELTAGSGLFAPWLFDKYRGLQLWPAAGFALAVSRIPGPGYLTCHGGGYVASGPTGPDKQPLPYLPPGARLLPTEGAGEVQTPLRYRGSVPLHLGDPVFFRHAKAGELCERFRTLYLISDGRIAGEVPTYRGEGQAFL
jgi:D-serine deaminase-like pyridoxal phosphate-dependent protein